MGDNTISVCVVCRNEAQKLGKCLESVAWADEVLVMDLESEDGSAGVARGHGATVVVRAPHPIVEPLRDELAERASGAWVLALDPDERVSPGLAKELRRLAERADIDAIVLPRMNIDFGWEPLDRHQRYEPQLRMYRPDRIRWPHFPNKLPVVPPDRVVVIDGRDHLVLRHERNVSVAETAERLVRYAPAQAQAMYDQGQRFLAKDMTRHLATVANRYFVRGRAWEEGMPGLVRATVLVNHHVYVWIAFWQICGSPRTVEDDAVVSRLGHPLRLLGAYLSLRRRFRQSGFGSRR